MADEVPNITAQYEADRWSKRAKAFLMSTLGPAEASRLVTLEAYNSLDTIAMQRGYLEGLAAMGEEPNEAEQKVSTSSQQPHVHAAKLDSRKVFVVHGRDNAAKDGVARFLQKVGLEPIILHEQANAGRTIIEKFETYSDDVAFAVVLLTPDDQGSEAVEPPQVRPRARQNVIMELGYFIGRLGRTRVCALHKGSVELPSDYQGVVYVEMDAAGAWRAKLAQELVQSKISIELIGLLGG
jgi:predicted nucleotide-binding protein